MPKKNLIWIAVIVGAGVATVLLTRPAPQGDDPDMARFGPVMRARHVLRQYSYETPSEARLQQGAVRGMVETLDEYSSYIPPERVKSFRARLNGEMICTGLVLAGDGDVPAEVVGSLPGSAAHEAGIGPGGRVVALDGNDVAGAAPAEIRGLLEAPGQKTVEVTIADPNAQVHSYTLTRRPLAVESVAGLRRSADGRWEYFLDAGRDLACIRVREFLPATAGQIQQALRELPGLAGLLLDLRDNPGGQLESGFAVADLFLRSGAIFTQVGAHGERQVHNARAEGTWPDVPIVVLVNDRTASAAEIVAGALQLHRRAVLVGERTRGKGLVQSMIDLPDNMGLANVTTGEFFIGRHVPVQRRCGAATWGIEPHVLLAPSAADERARRRYWLGVDVVGTIAARTADEAQTTATATAPATRPARPVCPAMSADAQFAAAVALLESPERMREILSRPASMPATSPAAAKEDKRDE
jgi:carboxyl-terminal processing protease